jgi:hypothetical protein
MKTLFLFVSLVLAACGGKGEDPQQPPKPDPATSFSGQVGNVIFSGTNSKDPVADKARAEAAIKLSK